MKKIKILTITLAIIAITMIAFFGVYTQVQNRMENQVKENTYAMDLEGNRSISLKVNTESETVLKDAEGKIVKQDEDLTDEQIAEKGYTKEERPYNGEEIKKVEYYKTSQKIIEERLKKLGVENYIIKLNEQSGEIVLELPENSQTDSIISSVNTTGKFEMVDSQTNDVLMDNRAIKTAKVMYGSGNSTTSNGTSVYLAIEFNSEGRKKLEEISNQYTKPQDNSTQEQTEEGGETAQDTKTEETSAEKKITMKIDGEEIMSTSFDEPIKTGKMQLSIGSSTTDTDTLQGYIEQASSMATVLDTGNIPVKYDLDKNQYVLSDMMTSNVIQLTIYIVLAIVVIGLIVFLLKYKKLGALGVISYIGLISFFMLVIRYANVVLSIEGFFGIVVVLILNYILVYQLLAKKNQKEVYKEFFVKIFPVIILVITFCFVNWIPISSFGMVMFWGIVLIAVYNGLVTNNLLKIETGKE